MTVVRTIATVSRNVSCLCLIHMYSHCKQMNSWEWNWFTGIFWGLII